VPTDSFCQNLFQFNCLFLFLFLFFFFLFFEIKVKCDDGLDMYNLDETRRDEREKYNIRRIHFDFEVTKNNNKW